MQTESTQVQRRTLVKGAAWAAPLVVASATVPAYAASPSKDQLGIEYGLFVTTSNNSKMGYNETYGTGTVNPTSPQAYFQASSRPESDISWSDATSRPTNSSSYQNGEGSFTPVTTGATGANGTYASSSGFWWSVPTTNPETGTGYIAGSTATLAAGAVFITEVEFTIPAGANAQWSTQNVRVAGQIWNKAISGKRTRQNATATYLAVATIAGTWSASQPVITRNSDGSYTFKGTITYLTTEAYTLTQTGTKYYGQTTIMPATVEVPTNYGWNYYQQTSYIQSATINYTANGTTTTLPLSGLTTTSRINP